MGDGDDRVTAVDRQPPVITAERLGGPRHAPRVHDVNLAVNPGTLLHIHGESGSGKTTLLRLLARLDPRAAGTLHLHGQPAEDVAITEWRRRVGLVFQDSRVFSGTIRENLAWAARLHGIDHDAERLLHRVGLELDPESPAERISGGEAKRLAIARALAIEPDALLLDEPTAPLDEANRRILRTLIEQLTDAQRLAVVLVSHLDEDLHLLPGQAIHLEHGRVARQCSSAELHRLLQENTSL